METHRLRLLKWLVCAAQSVDDLKKKLLDYVNSTDYGGVNLQPYSVLDGFGFEYSKGDKKVQIEYTPDVDRNGNGRIDPNEYRVVVRYGGQSASATIDSYGTASDPAQALLASGLSDLFGISSQEGSQSGSSTSTLNSTFNEAILPPVEPKAAEETERAGGAEEKKKEREEEKKKGGAFKFQAITTDLEYERFKAGGVSDNAVGLMAAYDARRESASAGARVTYARAVSAKLNRFSSAGYLKFSLGENVSCGGLVNVSGGSGGGAATAYSGGPFFAVVRKGEKGTVSFGVLHQYTRSEGVSANYLIYGTTFGFYVGRSGALNISGMRMSNVDGWESFSVLGATYSYLISSNFSLTLGYKTVFEVSGYTSNKLTVGMNRSFF